MKQQHQLRHSPYADVDCGRVPAIFKGEISYINGTTYLASQVSYECTPGNRLSGHRVRFCGPDARWTGGSPKCEEVRCDAPDLPSNGSAIYIGNDRSFKEQSFSVGVTVQYACDYGHVVKGSWSSRLCQANGEWSGEAPVCKFVDCGPPPSIENGNYQLKHPPTGSVGTALPFEATRRSDNNNPSSSPSGAGGGGGGAAASSSAAAAAGATGSFTYYGTIAHYNCDNNFKLTGQSQRECLESGQWRTPLPTCEPVQCPKPDYFDEYTQVSLVSRFLSNSGNEASSANSDQTTNTGKAIRIIANNQWINHDLAGLAYGVGDKLHYSCVPGFELYGGPETRTCTQYGQWSGSSTPRCRLIDCARPAPIGPEGRYFLINETTTFNSIVEYSCVRPFKLVEVKVRQSGNLIETLNVAQAGVTPILTSLPVGVKVCANNGQWMPNDQQPKCVRPNSGSSSGGGGGGDPGSGTNQNSQHDGADNGLDSGSFRPGSGGGASNDRDANGNRDGKLNAASGVSTDSGGNDINLDPLGSSVHHQHHQNLNANQASTSLWAKIVIAIILMIMFGLIMLTLICIRSNKRTKQPPSPHHRSHIMVTPNGHPAGAMQIQLAAASSAMLGGGQNGQLKQGHHQDGSAIPVQQATALMQATNPNIYMNGATKMFANGMGVVGGNSPMKQAHHMTQMHLNHYGDIGNGSLMMATVNGRSMVALGGNLVMNDKSSSLGIAAEQRHLATSIEHPVSVSSASILDSYSRLSFESGDGQANGNKTIRNNPNGLVTFVSPSQQQQNKHHNHHQGKQNGAPSGGGGATAASQNQVSPQSISTSLSMSPSSSPSSSSSAHHTTATRLSTTDSASSSSSSSSSQNVKINQQQQQQQQLLASSGGYQSPHTHFSGQQQGPAQLSPPSLPAHPPPSHRVQQQQQASRQKAPGKSPFRQSQQMQQDAYIQQQQGIATKSNNHHYMEPSM